MNTHPLIGICMRPGDSDGLGTNLASVDIRYVHAIEEAGGSAVALPYGFEPAKYVHDILSHVDGLLLTGGGDISPYSFGGRPYAEQCVAKVSFLSAERDVFEWAAALAAWEMELPTLGICRGMQVMNVSFGGTLVRDVSEQPGATFNHACYDHPTEGVHSVRFKEGSRLREIIGEDEIRVNSLHHQAISDVAKAANVVAWAPDNTPEGLEFPEKDFYLGVQWHPEILRSTPQLFEAFVEAAGAPRKN